MPLQLTFHERHAATEDGLREYDTRWTGPVGHVECGGEGVLVMTVNPAAGLLSPTTFRPSARYEFKVDTGTDTIEDISLRVKFGR